jgi:urease accessory protein
MERITELVRAGEWPQNSEVDCVSWTWEERQRRRRRFLSDQGRDLLLDLPRVLNLNEGDGLVLGKIGIIRVRAALEPVLRIEASHPEDLIRIAWHLGNRHCLIALRPGGILLAPDDHVLAGMLKGLGARVDRTLAPFTPETGAYGHLHGVHDHSAGHEHDS